jgi:hypothetical protein
MLDQSAATPAKATRPDDRDGADEGERREGSGEAAAEHPGLQRDQLEVDHWPDDEERQACRQGERGEPSRHEGVGLGADGQDDGEPGQHEHGERAAAAERLEAGGRDRRLHRRHQCGADHEEPAGLHEVVDRGLDEAVLVVVGPAGQPRRKPVIGLGERAPGKADHDRGAEGRQRPGHDHLGLTRERHGRRGEHDGVDRRRGQQEGEGGGRPDPPTDHASRDGRRAALAARKDGASGAGDGDREQV